MTSQKEFLVVVCFLGAWLKTVKLIQLHDARVSVMSPGSCVRTQSEARGRTALSAETGVNRVEAAVRVSREIALHACGLVTRLGQQLLT